MTLEVKTMFELLSGYSKRATLEIVWRNPDRVRSHRRRHTFEHTDKHAFYVLQEFVEDGWLGHWTTISNLEVAQGGRAA